MTDKQLLDFFNTLPADIYSTNMQPLFISKYEELANSIAKPVLDRINNSDVRKRIKTVLRKLPKSEITYEEIGWQPAQRVTNKATDELIKVFTISSSIAFSLNNILNEAEIENMETRLANTIITAEALYVNYVESIGLLDKATLYIIRDYIPIYDPCMFRLKRIGFFGWEEAAFVVEQ